MIDREGFEIQCLEERIKGCCQKGRVRYFVLVVWEGRVDIVCEALPQHYMKPSLKAELIGNLHDCII